jgi:hypothetical protein
MTLLGGLASYASGCGSSNNDGGGGGNQGGACCACLSPECNNPRTLTAPAGTTVSNCTTYCQAQAAYLANCTAGSVSGIVGVGVTCPKDGGTSTGVGGAGGAGGSIGAGGSVGLGGSSGAGGTTFDGGSTASFGNACTSSATCGGLQCLNDLGTGFTYPNGICSLPCTPPQSNPCGSIGGVCVTYTSGTAGICLQQCNLGQAAALPAVKCQGRQDEACQPVNQTQQNTPVACLPSCVTNADCGSKKCHPGLGVCADTVTPSPIGAPCTVDATGAASDCGDGFCLTISTSTDGGVSTGFCSAACTVGAVDACGFTRNPVSSASGPVGACTFVQFQNSLDPTGLGLNNGDPTEDVGFCGQLCDAPADCSLRVPGWGCDITPQSTQFFNHGVCEEVATPVDAGGQ